jgi:hypothetical protein
MKFNQLPAISYRSLWKARDGGLDYRLLAATAHHQFASRGAPHLGNFSLREIDDWLAAILYQIDDWMTVTLYESYR